MTIEFRVLAIPLNTKNYKSENIKSIFNIENPILDKVDNFDVMNTVNIINVNGWKPTSEEVKISSGYMIIGFIGNISTQVTE